jgi:uncharacterized protein with NRDE domain
MCLIVFAYKTHPRYELILAANRDEFYSRPTASAAFWEDAPEILAGRDLVAGGTWLGVTRTGRFAAVTNYREPLMPRGEKSRGNLVSEFLYGRETPVEYLQALEKHDFEYSGFNLLVGDFTGKQSEIAYSSNRNAAFQILPAGIYGLSNHLLDTPWHKVLLAKKMLAENIANSETVSPDALFKILQNSELAKDEDLPETGVGFELEKLLSPVFIESENYGTRCSTVVLIEKNGRVSFQEKIYKPQLVPASSFDFDF